MVFLPSLYIQNTRIVQKFNLWFGMYMFAVLVDSIFIVEMGTRTTYGSLIPQGIRGHTNSPNLSQFLRVFLPTLLVVFCTVA